MSLLTLFLHLFQHRMLALIYSHALTSIVATLKSFLEYSCFIPRLSSGFFGIEHKKSVPMPFSIKRHRDGFLLAVSPYLFNHRKPLYRLSSYRVPFDTALLPSFHYPRFANCR